MLVAAARASLTSFSVFSSCAAEPFHRGHEIRNEVGAALQIGLDVGPSGVAVRVVFDELIVLLTARQKRQRKHRKHGEQKLKPRSHGRKARDGLPRTQSLRDLGGARVACFIRRRVGNGNGGPNVMMMKPADRRHATHRAPRPRKVRKERSQIPTAPFVLADAQTPFPGTRDGTHSQRGEFSQDATFERDPFRRESLPRAPAGGFFFSAKREKCSDCAEHAERIGRSASDDRFAIEELLRANARLRMTILQKAIVIVRVEVRLEIGGRVADRRIRRRGASRIIEGFETRALSRKRRGHRIALLTIFCRHSPSDGPELNLFYQADRTAQSSSLPSFASTLKSSSVDVSPCGVLFPDATSFKSRRMIFPLRVFGNASVKRI